MRKKIYVFIVMLVLALALPITAYADSYSGGDGWSCTFTSDKKMVSNFKSGNFDDTIYNMEPGDDSTFNVAIKNEYNTDTDWYMENKVLKSLEESQKVANKGAYTYKLTYVGPGGEKVIYDSDKVGGANSSDSAIITADGAEGLHQATSSLEDFFYLDTLKKGESGKLTLIVKLEGESLVNAYQDTLAQLQMNFAVELREGGTVRVVRGGRTGDYSQIFKWSFVALGAAFFLIVVLAVSYRNNKARKQRVKNHSKIIGMMIFGVTCLFLMGSVDAQAAPTNNYQYTITISAGKEGVITGYGEKVVIKKNAGDTFTFNALKNVTVNDPEHYYVRGIKISGKDNNQKLSTSSFKVVEDTDIVVAYGAVGSMVAYTVQYTDADGNELLAPDTYYGNVGDKPVVAYRYIENYRPQAENLTKTLSADENQNIFRFVYTRVEQPVVTDTVIVPGTATPGNTNTGTTDANGTATTTENNQNGDNTQTDANGQNTEDGQAPAEVENTEPAEGEAPVEITDQEVPETQEIIDLDDSDVPLADSEVEEDDDISAVMEDDGKLVGTHSNSKLPIVVGIISAAVAAFGIGMVVHLVRKKDNE